MAVVSISEAAKLAGKSRKTIQRYVADGRISMSHNVAGKSGIDTSELARVFGELSQGAWDMSHATLPQPVPQDVAAKLVELQTENAILRAQIEAKDANLTDLRQSLRLLEHKKEDKRHWWSFWKK
jgi:hypothetical protein